jgi:hypothetical protein
MKNGPAIMMIIGVVILFTGAFAALFTTVHDFQECAQINAIFAHHRVRIGAIEGIMLKALSDTRVQILLLGPPPQVIECSSEGMVLVDEPAEKKP